MRVSALSHHQKCTSVYTFDGEFQLTLKHRFWLNQRHPCRFWISSTYQRYACGTFLPYSLYLHRLFQKAYGRAFFRTDRDVRGSTQKRRFCAAKTRVQKCTRMYTSGQAISKGLRRSMLYDMLLLKIVLNVSKLPRIAGVINRNQFLEKPGSQWIDTNVNSLALLCFNSPNYSTGLLKKHPDAFTFIILTIWHGISIEVYLLNLFEEAQICEK